VHLRVLRYRLPFRVRRTILLAAATLVVGAAGAAAPMLAQAPSRPNVVLILADDLDLLLGTIDHLPNLKRLLADSGTTFTNATVSNSVCCPSRATLLRGQYTHGHRIYTNTAPAGGHAKFVALGRDSSTVAVWLRQAGYATGLLGKYLNGYPGPDRRYVPPGWSTWSSPVAGGYEMLGYTMNENGQTRAYGRAPEDYITDVLLRQARDFVRAAGEARKPFFLKIATYAPHQPATPAPRHAHLLPELRAPRTPSFNEADVADKSAEPARPLIAARQLARLDTLHRKRVLSMLAVDEMIAGLVSTLAERGQLANTWFIFTSDNGFHLGQHRLVAGKTTAYEEDVRVPFIVRGPGVARGARITPLVENVDLAPTIAAIAGVQVPAFVDGRSILPLLRDETPASWRHVALVEAYPGGEPDARAMRRGQGRRAARMAAPAARALEERLQPRYAALRGERFSFVQHASGQRELYDLVRDPHQLENVAARTDGAVLEALEAWSRAMSACEGSTCRDVSSRIPAPLRALVTGRR